MRLLANENFPEEAVRELRNAGHDAAWVRTDAPGSNDRDVLARAVAEERVLITFDKDFGELAFRTAGDVRRGALPHLDGVSGPRGADCGHGLGSRSDWAGHFAVVEEHRVRMTALPPTGNG
jgi:Domain of unknown function (DUF5615)